MSVRFDVEPAEPYLTIPRADPATLLSGEPVFPLRTVNVDRVRVRAVRVAPERYGEYLRWEGRRTGAPPDRFGEPVLDRTIRIRGAEDAVTDTGIDLAEALKRRLRSPDPAPATRRGGP